MIQSILWLLLTVATNVNHCSDGSGQLYTAHSATKSIAIVYCLPAQDCTVLTDENGNFAEYESAAFYTSVTPRPEITSPYRCTGESCKIVFSDLR